jgi:DNA polymerase delta subunit 1
MKKPLLRIFKPILSDPEKTLFSKFLLILGGAHTKIISTASSKTNPLAKFTVVKKTCLSCKANITNGAVCKNCMHKIREIYLERKMELNYYERIYNGIILCYS